jgi:beta-1,4-mannosyl-glycoprotein beta-1,4-N-acetylglucosaminyltransferase
MRKIYDCFCFFNELDILELRLNILNDYVDYFVIVESSVTHTGVPKPYYFELNKERFNKFIDKIIHVKVEDTPNDFINLPSIDNTNFDTECLLDINKFIQEQTKRFNRKTEIHYGRDFYQKECVRRGLYNCCDDDIIMFSDCDEIPNPSIFQNVDLLLSQHKFLTCLQKTYYYFINVFKEDNWGGTRIGKFKDLKKFSYNELRAQGNYPISNCGWHFSFMGGAENVKNKINSYSAQEMNNSHIINSVDTNIKNNIDPFFRCKLTDVKIDETYPKFLLNNLEKYQFMIK